jgi:hypothetical protein
MNAVRITTNFRHSIVVTLKDDSSITFRVFLPNRFFHVSTYEDINDTNKEKIKLQIVDQGNCERIGAYGLPLTSV